MTILAHNFCVFLYFHVTLFPMLPDYLSCWDVSQLNLKGEERNFMRFVLSKYWRHHSCYNWLSSIFLGIHFPSNFVWTYFFFCSLHSAVVIDVHSALQWSWEADGRRPLPPNFIIFLLTAHIVGVPFRIRTASLSFQNLNYLTYSPPKLWIFHWPSTNRSSFTFQNSCICHWQ